jgi:hypothetical protein
MNKTIDFWRSFIAGVIAFALAGCDTVVLPMSQPTISLSTYIHYAPSEITNVYLEFDYPRHWFFSEEKIRGTENISIGLGDPRLLNVPTRAPNEPHGTPSDFGRVYIWIKPIKPGQSLDIIVEPHKQGYSSASWITPTNEYEITVDGIDAIVFEYQVEPIDDNGFTSLMFERNIFFVAKNQLYQITFLVSENERGGEFEQGYEYFFKSIRITP